MTIKSYKVACALLLFEWLWLALSARFTFCMTEMPWTLLH